jgi:hypothetical protein
LVLCHAARRCFPLVPHRKCGKPLVTNKDSSTISIDVICPSDVTNYEVQYQQYPIYSGNWKSISSASNGTGHFILKNLASLSAYIIRVRETHINLNGKTVVSFGDPVTIRTSGQPPMTPGTPHLNSRETSFSTITLIAPYVDDRSVPISYSKVLLPHRSIENFKT